MKIRPKHANILLVTGAAVFAVGIALSAFAGPNIPEAATSTLIVLGALALILGTAYHVMNPVRRRH